MSKVNYRFYEDKDAEGVLDLFRRNEYYLGKRPVSVEQFRQSLINRGAYFAAVGEDEDTIIAYMAAYPSGDGRVCRKHQVLLGGLLVDEKYRGKLYSISTIYTMIVSRIARMNEFTTIIGEVESFRKQSLLMHRFFGSVMVNKAVRHDPLVNQMYNFLPGYFLLFDEESASRKEKMTKLLPKPDKIHFAKEDEIIDGEYVNTNAVLSYGKVRMLNHIHTGIVDEIELEDAGFVFGLSRNRKQFILRRNDPKSKRITVSSVNIRMYENETVAEEITTAADDISRNEFEIKGGIDRIHVSAEGICDGFWFYPVRPVEINGCDKHALWGSGHTLDTATGLLKVNTGRQNILEEMWPFMMPPYLIGDIEPYYGMDIKQTDGKTSFVRKLADHTVQRDYIKSGNEISIRTVVKSEASLNLKPKFQFLVRDDKAKVVFTGRDGSETLMNIDEERDLKIASREIPYERFVSEPYNKTPFEKITIETCEGSYTIMTDKAATAYLQFDYIGIDYDMSTIPYENGGFDFGTIRIIGEAEEK